MSSDDELWKSGKSDEDAAEANEEEDSTLESSLDSESQGLLAGLEAAFSENVTDEVDDAVTEAEEAGTLDDLLELGEGETAEEALEEQALEITRQLVSSLRRFFLSMGLSVVVDVNADSSAGVVAVNLPAPFHIPEENLPGGKGFEDRNIRLFKVGEGALDADSEYTSTESEVGTVEGKLFYAPAFSGIVTDLLDGETLEAFQATVDAAYTAIHSAGGSPTDADFDLLDRIRVYHELSRRVEDASLVSSGFINTLVENKDSTIKIKGL